MSFQPQHIGLYFGQSQITTAHDRRSDHPHLQSAWQWLLAQSGDVIRHRKPDQRDQAPQAVIKPDLSPAGEAVQAALRFRFLEQPEAGEQAQQALQTGFGLRDAGTLFSTIQQTLAAAQIIELLRPDFTDLDDWLQEFAGFSDSLVTAYDGAAYRDQQWLMALQVVSGIVLDDRTRFEAGTTRLRHAIDHDIHPEGYLKSLIEGAKDAPDVYRQMTQAVGALVLAAEAATQAGVDLWAYTNRDVSINTAVTYLVFYYFYPDKWRWGTGLTLEDTENTFRDDGAWLDIATYRAHPRGVEYLLEAQRPFFSPCGGLTTLTHCKIEPRKRRGLFG